MRLLSLSDDTSFLQCRTPLRVYDWQIRPILQFSDRYKYLFNYRFSHYYPNYRPQRSWGKVMFLQASVILLKGGVPDTPPELEQTPPPTRYTPGTRYPPGTRYTPRTRYSPPGPGTPPRPGSPPGPGTPPRDQVHPRDRYTPNQVQPPPTRTRYTPPMQSRLGDTVNERAVRILLECNLVFT